MNIICLDCGLADPDAIWEYETLGTNDGAIWSEIATLIMQHQTHRLIFLGTGNRVKERKHE